MPNTARTANAKAAASSYAPKPNGSAVTYGLIAVSLLGAGLVFFAAFYGIDLVIYPAAIFLSAIAAFATGVVVRHVRQRRHSVAFANEYALRTPPPAQPEVHRGKR